jgi:hypothetical protein
VTTDANKSPNPLGISPRDDDSSNLNTTNRNRNAENFSNGQHVGDGGASGYGRGPRGEEKLRYNDSLA